MSTTSADIRIKIAADARSAEESLRTLSRSLEQIRGGSEKTTTASQRLKSSFKELGSSASLLKGALASAGLGVLIKEALQASLALERLTKMFFAASGGALQAGRDLEYVRGVANRLGLDFVTSAGSFGKFAAAIKGTALEGEKGRKVFEAVSMAATALSLRADETAGAMNALQQMVSKGKVSAEELRQQLGERLPGAYRLAAEAMGMTTAELGKQMEQGKIYAEDLLPKLAEKLQETYGAAATNAANSAQASINRFNNALFETKAALGDALAPAFVGLMEAISPVLTTLKEFVVGFQIVSIKAAGFFDKVKLWLTEESGTDEYKNGMAAIAQAEAAAVEDLIGKYVQLSTAAATAGESKVKAGKIGTDITKTEIKAFQSAGRKIKDSWQIQAEERFEVHSRGLDVILASEKDANDERLKMSDLTWGDVSDSWMVKEKERLEVHSRGLDVMIANEEAAAKSREDFARQYMGYASNAFQMVADVQDKTSREGFEAAKDMQTGAAVVNTAGAIMNALSTVQPYPAALAAAAMAAATGAAQIASIQSASFGGGGSVVAPSGSVSSGGGGGSVGASIGAPIQSVQELQTAESLRGLAESAENASLAVGRMADGLTSIADLFSEGSLAQRALAGAPGSNVSLGHNKSIVTNLTDAITTDIKQIFKSTKAALFGGSWETKRAGIALSLGSGSLDAVTYKDQKKSGGLFGSSKKRTKYGEIDQDFESLLSGQLDKIKSTINIARFSMGMSGDLAAASLDMTKIKTAGKKPEEIQEAFEAWFQTAADALGDTVNGLEEFRLAGEGSFDALVRLAGALQSVNESFELVGVTLFDATAQGANAAYKIQDLFGGADNFSDAMDDYFTSIFTEAEQDAQSLAVATRQVQTSFNLLNTAFEDDAAIAIPKTRAEFRSLVESLDLTTDRGAALFAELAKLAPAFADLIDITAELAAANYDLYTGLVSRSLELAGVDSGVIGLYELRISQESELAAAQERGLDVGLLQVIQEREFSAARLEVMEQQRQALQEFTADIMVRELGATGQDAAGGLLQLKISQRKELNAAEAAGYDTARLRAVQASEYQNALSQAHTSQIDNIESQAQVAADATDQVRQAWLDVAESIKDTLDNLLGGNLSTLSPEQKLARARSEYQSTLAAAKGGDINAAGELSGVAEGYASAARGYYASSPQYASIFNSIVGGLNSVSDLALEMAETPEERSAIALEEIQASSLAAQLSTQNLDAQVSALFAEYSNVIVPDEFSLLQGQLDTLADIYATGTNQVDELKNVKAVIVAGFNQLINIVSDGNDQAGEAADNANLDSMVA